MRGDGTDIAPQVDTVVAVRVIFHHLLGVGNVLQVSQLVRTHLDVHGLRERTFRGRPHEELIGTLSVDRPHTLPDKLPGRAETTVVVEDTELGHVPGAAMIELRRQLPFLAQLLQKGLDVVRGLGEGHGAAEADQLAPPLLRR